MKTADLIPFILLELNESDKYGFELTKAIETKSSGAIIIKQPTLYTLLKKLEKSKFITSYWQDSEIGGKRHYYTLTENGRLQVSTLPSYDFLLKNISSETDFETINQPSIPVKEEVKPQHRVSIMDELLNSAPSPIESVLPTQEVFAENNLDNSTEISINAENSTLLKDEKSTEEEKFATSPDVMKFTEKITPSNISKPDQTKALEETNELFNVEFTTPVNNDEITYVDYVDLKNNENYIYSKKLTKNLLLKTLSTSLSLIALIMLCAVITSFTGRSALFYVFFISAILVAIFYPVIFVKNMEKIRLKFQQIKYSYNIKKRLYGGLTAIISVIAICVISNICMKSSSMLTILSIKNFENFYAPILFTLVYFLDILYVHLFNSKINK